MASIDDFYSDLPYGLDRILKDYCNQKKHREEIVLNIFTDTINKFQWYYQNTNDKQYRDSRNKAKREISNVIELLKAKGEYSLAEQVAYTLDIENLDLNKSMVLTQAIKFAKNKFSKHKMNHNYFTKNISEYFKSAFIDWCDKYPLNEAPAHYDSNWEPAL